MGCPILALHSQNTCSFSAYPACIHYDATLTKHWLEDSRPWGMYYGTLSLFAFQTLHQEGFLYTSGRNGKT